MVVEVKRSGPERFGNEMLDFEKFTLALKDWDVNGEREKSWDQIGRGMKGWGFK